MYHTSPTKIQTVNDSGIAGSCLFFSDEVYKMSDASIYAYEADFDCVNASQLCDSGITEEIAERFCVDQEAAESLLDATASEWDIDATDADDSWWLQGRRGECAVRMGYDGCEDRDEQGTVYIVPMAGREAELNLISA